MSGRRQGFLTRQALGNVAKTTLDSARGFEEGDTLDTELHAGSA